jgi:hypothetical protein
VLIRVLYIEIRKVDTLPIMLMKKLSGTGGNGFASNKIFTIEKGKL